VERGIRSISHARREEDRGDTPSTAVDGGAAFTGIGDGETQAAMQTTSRFRVRK